MTLHSNHTPIIYTSFRDARSEDPTARQYYPNKTKTSQILTRPVREECKSRIGDESERHCRRWIAVPHEQKATSSLDTPLLGLTVVDDHTPELLHE